MLKKALAFVLFLGIVLPLSAAAEDSLVKFKGGIGVIPVSSGAGLNADGPPPTSPNVNRNVVRGVNPPGQIWVIADLRADVTFDGSIKVRGKGLLLGGGNAIGSNANASVFATLICGTATPTLHSTNLAGVPLEPNGNFRIDDSLTPQPPADCASPVLLIRNKANMAWFAAGIPKRENDDD